MSRILLLTLLSVLVLTGCPKQSGTGGGGGTIGGGGVDPDPSPQPSAGIPDQNSMSLSVSQYNLDCFNIDGPTADITVRLADQLNNNDTIPDGTTVYFAAEGGAIGSQCQTTNGACTVQWECQAFRPTDGRVTIVAWTEGTESFNDNNSNGFFDDVIPDTMVAATDVGEPFIDKDENGVRDPDEEFVNYPNPGLSTGGTYTGPDGLYSGVNCAYPGLCATNQSVFISKQAVMVMSAGNFAPRLTLIEDTGTDYDVYSGAVPVDVGSKPTLLFLVTDANGNALPAGTTISFDSGDLGDLPGTSSFTVPSTSATAINGPPWVYGDVSPLVVALRINETTDNATDESGTLIITVEVEGRSPREFYLDLFDPAM
jgi:hypothetical protein